MSTTPEGDSVKKKKKTAKSKQMPVKEEDLASPVAAVVTGNVSLLASTSYCGIPLHYDGEILCYVWNALCVFIFSFISLDVVSASNRIGWLTQGAMNAYARFFFHTVLPEKQRSSLALNVSTWSYQSSPGSHRLDCHVNVFICHYTTHWSLAIVLKCVSCQCHNHVYV